MVPREVPRGSTVIYLSVTSSCQVNHIPSVDTFRNNQGSGCASVGYGTLFPVGPSSPPVHSRRLYVISYGMDRIGEGGGVSTAKNAPLEDWWKPPLHRKEAGTGIILYSKDKAFPDHIWYVRSWSSGEGTTDIKDTDHRHRSEED